MTIKIKVLLAAVAALVLFALGRYTAPEKIKVETKTVEVEKKTTTDKKNVSDKKHKETITTEVTKPDGTKEITTKVVEDNNFDKKQNSSETDLSNKSTYSNKEVSSVGSHLTLSALAGAKTKLGPIEPVYGGMISRQLIGPINMGLFGLSSGEAGVSLGVTF